MAESKITLGQVRHVALLARLRLSADEETRLQADMSSMLGYVEKLNELDTTNVPPTAQVGEPGTCVNAKVALAFRADMQILVEVLLPDDLAATVTLHPQPFSADLLFPRIFQIAGLPLKPGHSIG